MKIVTTALCSGVLLAAAPVHADDLEIGGFAGLHVFNDDNELGVVDVASAPSLKNALDFGVRVAYQFTAFLAAEGELGVVPTRVRDASVDVVNLNWRLAAVGSITRGRVTPFALLGFGASTAQSSDTTVFGNDTDVVGQIGVGAKFRVGDDWGVRVDGRVLLPPSSEGDGPTTEWEGLVGLYRTFGGAAAPAQPTLAAATDGDADADGKVGEADQCPDQAEDADSFQDDDGCPDGDNDGDHIADADDRCADQAEIVNSFEDDDGCPDGDPDSDADGLTAASDRCPDQAEDKDGFQDDDGCPDPDNDGDGVADTTDRCLAEPETANGFQDDDGCADKVPERLASIDTTAKSLKFTSSSDKLGPAAKKSLDAVVAVLKEFGDVRLEVSGHTDTTGDRTANVELSRRRAEAIRAYMVEKGIAAERITAVGYGPDKPVGDNATPGGRAANRRIEMRLVSTSAAEPAAGTP